jgi:Alginate export
MAKNVLRLILVCASAWSTIWAADPPEATQHLFSPAEAVNAHVPQWIRFSGELRARGEGFLGDRFQDGRDDLYLLQRVRLGVQIQPTPWLKFYAQAQDARVSFTDRIPSAPPLQDSADIRQAYVQFGGAETQLLDLRVGRQDLAFGEERLVGASNWGNIGRSFDAVRLGLHHGNYRVDAFASSVVVPRDHAFDHHVDGDNLHGLYGDIGGWIPNAKVQPYLLWRLSPSVSSETVGRGRLDHKTLGVRLAGNMPQKIEYTMELALQNGSWAGDDMKAWAGFWRIGREFGALPLRPRFRLEVNHASGDSNPTDGRHGTFDVLYPTAHDKYGMADQVGWKNINHIGLTGEVKAKPSLILQAKFHEFWLASARDGLYNAGGALIVRDATGASGTHVGHEVDVQALWTASQHLAIGGGLGHLFPGSFLQHTTPGHGYTFPYVSLTYGL